MKTIEPNPPLLTPVGFAVAAAAATTVAIIAFVLPQASAPSTWQSAPVVAQSRDAIALRNVNGSMFVYASLGGVPDNMLLDTGATGSQITVPIGNALLARKQAYIVPGIFFATIANGSAMPYQRVVVRTMTIGRHTLHNVQMSVGDDGAPVLLTQLDRKLQVHNQIRFN